MRIPRPFYAAKADRIALTPISMRKKLYSCNSFDFYTIFYPSKWLVILYRARVTQFGLTTFQVVTRRILKTPAIPKGKSIFLDEDGGKDRKKERKYTSSHESPGDERKKKTTAVGGKRVRRHSAAVLDKSEGRCFATAES